MAGQGILGIAQQVPAESLAPVDGIGGHGVEIRGGVAPSVCPQRLGQPHGHGQHGVALRGHEGVAQGIVAGEEAPGVAFIVAEAGLPEGLQLRRLAGAGQAEGDHTCSART